MRPATAIRPPLPLGFAPRSAALEILRNVLDERQPLDAALEASLGRGGQLNALDPRDRAFARILVATTLRRHGQIADAIDERLERPLPKKSGPLRHILELGVTQILFLETARHAAVSLAVEQAARDSDARHFKGLANAVLRGIARDREAILARQDAPRLNTPDWLWRRWERRYGADRTRSFAEAHALEPPLDLTVKEDAAGWAERVGGQVLPNGSIRLLPKGPVDVMPGFAEGAWWVQDAAATLPARLLGDLRGKEVADLCAAPGGKTAQLVAGGAVVTAFDLSENRLVRLNENLTRLGLSAETVAADLTKPGWSAPESFDAVLLDAPCSSTGTIRRHPDVALLKSEADISALARIQAAILANAVRLLRPGGVLLYVTCSLEPEEGEAQVEAALGKLALVPYDIEQSEVFGLAEPAGPAAVRTLPDGLGETDPKLGGLAGFFIARFRRS